MVQGCRKVKKFEGGNYRVNWSCGAVAPWPLIMWLNIVLVQFFRHCIILALTFSYGICKRWPASVQKRTRPSFFLCQLISLAILWRNKIKSAVGRIEVKLATGIFFLKFTQPWYEWKHYPWLFQHETFPS